MRENYELIVIGAGPAGLTAAASATRLGVGTLVLDEYMKPGGRLLGQLHQEPDGSWWNGIREAQALVREASEAGVALRTGVSVSALEPDRDGKWTVRTNTGTLRADNVLLATGAAESAVPLPGWTLPGVMSIGAAQVMTNVQRVRIGRRGVVVGMNVLAMAIVSELRLAGIELAAIVLPPLNPLTGHASEPQRVLSSLLRFAHLAPSPLFRLGAPLLRAPAMRRLALSLYPRRGMRLLGTPLQLRRAALEIVGREAVEGVRIVDVHPDGIPVPESERFVEADFVCIAGGLYPLAELAAVAGCPFRYVPELGGHIPVHDEQMRTPLPGLFVAGNITGVESARVAIAQGELAGLSVAASMGDGKRAVGETALRAAMQRVKRARRDALIQFHPRIAECRERLYGEAFKTNEPQ